MLLGLLFNLLPIALIVGFFIYFLRQMQQGGSKGAMSFGRSRAKLLNEDQTKATFADVAAATKPKRKWPNWSSFCAIPASSRSWAAKFHAAC